MESELEKIAYIYGDVCVRRKKQRRKRQKLLIIELLFDYAKNSTLHGLRYIVERGLSIIERIFWLITVIVSIVLCSIFIYNVYQKWITSPVIVTVNGRLASVGSVPFPAITICPRVKVDKLVYNFTDVLKRHENGSVYGEELEELDNISTMCETSLYLSDKNVTNSTIVTDITKVALSMDHMFLMCVWNNDRYSYLECDEMFSKVYTAEGICYSANSLAANEIFENTIQTDYPYLDSSRSRVGWSLENGYNFSVEDPYPRRGRILGPDPDLQIVMTHESDRQDMECNQLYSGYKIYLQHPADFPQSSLYYYAAIPNQVTSLAINFHELNSDSSLKEYKPSVRQCYFPEDRKLRYFKIYTAKNCQAECISNYTFRLCNCVALYMPHDNSSQICATSIKNVICINTAKEDMAEKEINAEIGLEKEGCRCLPSCNTVEYDAEILKNEYFLAEKVKKLEWFNTANKYSRIDLYFKKPQFVTMQRRELFGVTDLLANVGGLLGLFLGFSFISLLEIFYFLTLRVGFILKRDLEEEKAKAEPKVDDFPKNLTNDKIKIY